MKLVAASSALLATIFAGTCPDIQDDPFVSFHGPGVDNNLDNMVFKQYCGPTSTGSANATDINSIAQGDFEKAHCRMKCKNWDTNYDQFGLSKLFWAKTRGRWKRTKYLYCRCKDNAQGEEICHWKRRARTDREKNMQDLEITRDQPKNQIQIACDVPTCQHVSTIPEYNAGGRVPKITTKDASGNKITVCENCNVNDNRNGVWKCYDKQGVELANDVRVPWRGWCSMSCGNEAVESPAKKKVHCKWPHFEDESPFAYQQYEPRKVYKLYNMLQKNRFKNDVNMDAEEGWKCYE